MERLQAITESLPAHLTCSHVGRDVARQVAVLPLLLRGLARWTRGRGRPAHLVGGLADVEQRAADVFEIGRRLLLHDVGKLVLAVCIPEQFKQIMVACTKTGRPQHEIEAELLGVTHAEVGAYLLGLWGLPHPIVEAVAYHHNPAAALEQTFDTPTGVALANALVDHFTEGRPVGLEAHLESLKVIDKLPQWQAIAKEEVEQIRKLAIVS